MTSASWVNPLRVRMLRGSTAEIEVSHWPDLREPGLGQGGGEQESGEQVFGVAVPEVAGVGGAADLGGEVSGEAAGVGDGGDAGEGVPHERLGVCR